jgi:hypothetical protein
MELSPGIVSKSVAHFLLEAAATLQNPFHFWLIMNCVVALIDINHLSTVSWGGVTSSRKEIVLVLSDLSSLASLFKGTLTFAVRILSDNIFTTGLFPRQTLGILKWVSHSLILNLN